MNPDSRVVIAGGGTGGHLYPGIAIAREIASRRPGSTITFAGTARGIETRVVPREGFELDLLRIAGLKGRSPLAAIRGIALLPLSFAGRVAHHLRGAGRMSVIGVGGYASGAVVMLAALRGIPTLLAEQNAVPGIDEPIARAGGERGGGDVRFDGVLLWQEGICRRQPGTSRVLRGGASAGGASA